MMDLIFALIFARDVCWKDESLLLFILLNGVLSRLLSRLLHAMATDILLEWLSQVSNLC
jgi:hypothetical protein